MTNPNEDYLHLTLREYAPRPGDTVIALCGYQWVQQPDMSFAKALDAAQRAGMCPGCELIARNWHTPKTTGSDSEVSA